MPAGKSARWVHQLLSDADEKISTVFMLKHDAAKLAELEATFWAVSDPKDARYGEHLSRTQVQALLTPPAGVAERVASWLRASGATVTAPNADMLEASMTASVANTVFGTTFAAFQHSENTGATIHRATSRSTGQASPATKSESGAPIAFACSQTPTATSGVTCCSA